jgi:hypothetical protein
MGMKLRLFEVVLVIGLAISAVLKLVHAVLIADVLIIVLCAVLFICLLGEKRAYEKQAAQIAPGFDPETDPRAAEELEMRKAVLGYAMERGFSMSIEADSLGVMGVFCQKPDGTAKLKVCEFALSPAPPHSKEWTRSLALMTSQIDEYIETHKEESEDENKVS